MAESTKSIAIKGITWNLVERFGIQGMKLVLGIWMARLLTPADYGLIGMISVFFLVAEVFVDSGFGQAYVQKKDVTDLDANTVFYANLFISLMVYACLWASAPAIAGFYEQPALVALARVMGGVVFINAFNMIQIARLTRAVDFKRKTKVTLAATLVSGIVGISAALLGFGVWSLVIQVMSNRILTTAGMWFTSKWRPGLQFSWISFRSLFSFGAWVLAAGVVRTVFDNIYILTIGKFFPASQLGFYTKAKQIQSLSAQQLPGAVSSVAFPILSQMQYNKLRLKEGAQIFLTHTMFITTPLLVALFVVAKPFVLLLLTEKWAPMIPYLQLLCIAGFLYPIHLVNVQILQVQGLSNLNFRITVIKNFLRIVNISLMYRFGVIFIIIGEIATSFLALVINTYYTRKFLNYGLLAQFKDMKPVIFSAVLAGMGGYVTVFSISDLYINFATGLIISLGGYIILQCIFNKIFFMGFLRLKENFVK
jgi:O-antigen/teichoic acid export membrane protein